MTYNTRRNLLGAISVPTKVAYHLYGVDYSGKKSNESVKLLKKARWHSQMSAVRGNLHVVLSHSSLYLYLDNQITSFDFNPSGERVAAMDFFGTCLISDLSTNRYRCHLKLGRHTGHPHFQRFSLKFSFPCRLWALQMEH